MPCTPHSSGGKLAPGSAALRSRARTMKGRRFRWSPLGQVGCNRAQIGVVLGVVVDPDRKIGNLHMHTSNA